MSFEQSNNDVDPLTDPDAPHDIPLPPRHRFRMRRRVTAFLDEPVEALVSDLPDWNFETIEVSNSVYRVTVTDSFGRNVEFGGTDLNDLYKRAAEAAKLIEEQCKNRD